MALRIRVVAAGKLKERPVRALIDDYIGRCARFARIEEFEVRDDAQVGARMEKLLVAQAMTVALEVDGRTCTSKGLADMVSRAALSHPQGMCFLVGGAYGLPPALSQRCDVQLSLSAMTLPHRLARLLLAEQIYRALSLVHGLPYAHED